MEVCLEDAAFELGPARWLWKPVLKRLLTGRWGGLVMRPGEHASVAGLDRFGVYVHVPFCRSLCPYCAYNRIRYQRAAYDRYERAIHQEIDLRAQQLGDASRRRLTSIYVGGGTPTLRPDSLAGILDHLQRALGAATSVGVETHPHAMDQACLDLLQEAGVSRISVGVQSLSDRLLARIGRSHDAAAAVGAVRRAVGSGFELVNADLMFALPGQTAEQLEADVDALFDLGVDQVTTYPLFGFPYAELGRRMGLKRIARPSARKTRRMLDAVRRRCRAAGMIRCSVWSHMRPGPVKFSSTTRHAYLGFGPSAGSMTGRQFWVNTFSVAEYARSLPDHLPVAAVMPVDRRLEMAYWLYWRLYELAVPRDSFRDRFGRELEDVFGGWLSAARLLGMMERRNGSYHVTEEGAHWIHRIQNEYALNYISRLWGRCRWDPWPEVVKL